MKKCCLVALSIAIAGTAHSRDLYGSEEHPVTPLELCLAAPIQLPPSNWSVYGLRCSLFYGESFDVYGIDLGLVGYNANRMAGLQLAAAVDWIESDL